MKIFNQIYTNRNTKIKAIIQFDSYKRTGSDCRKNIYFHNVSSFKNYVKLQTLTLDFIQ